ncbi:MAG: GNAT family N-acetyltransferase [Anaerolineae bacterium]
MVAWTVDERCESGPIRPFAPQRDLKALADLIEAAFGPELASTGSQIAQDLRQVALLGPVLRAASSVLPFFTGYVWIEEGRLVGNVSLSQEERDPGTWSMANVAVLPEFQGRGIGGGLVDRAIGHVRAHRGRRMHLQVRADNTAALSLYRHRGFRSFDTLHEMDLSGRARPHLTTVPPAPLRPIRSSDTSQLVRLMLASRPFEAQSQYPIRLSEYRRGWLWRLEQSLAALVSGQQLYELVGDWQGEVVAHARLVTRLFRGPNELDLQVAPHVRGKWEHAIAQRLLAEAPELPRYHTRASISAAHPEAVVALGDLGFCTLRVLEQMVLDLHTSPGPGTNP